MPRSLKKPVYIDFKLIKALMKDRSRGKQVNTYSRRSTIIPEMIGFIVGVYNGQKFIPVSVTESMVGHKLGEFSFTRKGVTRKGDDKAKVGNK